MPSFLAYLGPAALVVGGSLFLLLLDRWVDGRPIVTRRLRRRDREPGVPGRRSVEVVAADLRRLSAQLAVVPSGAPLVRWQALWAAYDEVLVEAAELLGVAHVLETTPVGTSRDIERLRVQAALEGAGTVVRG